MNSSYAPVLVVVDVMDADLWFVIQDSALVSVSQCQGDKGHVKVHRKHDFRLNKETRFLINFISNAISSWFNKGKGPKGSMMLHLPCLSYAYMRQNDTNHF